MNILFKTLSWKNFLSTGNVPNVINLNASPSTLIVGRNGQGKSTILDALTYALFGKPFRNINKPQLMNSINGKNLVVEIEFEVNKTSYKIIRGMKPGIFEIHCNGKMIDQTAAVKDYQKVLEQQILKLNYKTFTQVVILGSASFVPFMELSPGNRRDVIEDILDISVFSTMNSILKDKILMTKGQLDNINTSLKIHKAKAETQHQIIDSLVTTKKEQTDRLKSQILENQADIDTLNSKVSECQESASNLLSKMENEEALKQDLDKVNRMKSKLNVKKEQVDVTVNFFEENQICPACSQGIPHDHKRGIIEKAAEERERYEQNLTVINDAIKVLLEKESINRDINKKVLDINIQISSSLSAINTLKKQNDKLHSQLDEFVENNANIDSEKLKLKDISSTIKSLAQQKNELAEQRNIQEAAALLLKDTGIKTAIIREYIPVMNKLINGYLSAMDFYVQFELDESFNEVIKSRHRDEFSYASFSEGEKTRINLAILFAWRQIAKMKNSVNTNLLIFDEIFDSSLDSAGTDYFLSIMESFGENENIFVISHKTEAMVDKFASIIKVEKKNDFSELSQTV